MFRDYKIRSICVHTIRQSVWESCTETGIKCQQLQAIPINASEFHPIDL